VIAVAVNGERVWLSNWSCLVRKQGTCFVSWVLLVSFALVRLVFWGISTSLVRFFLVQIGFLFKRTLVFAALLLVQGIIKGLSAHPIKPSVLRTAPKRHCRADWVSDRQPGLGVRYKAFAN
jgi:hypothetical protein